MGALRRSLPAHVSFTSGAPSRAFSTTARTLEEQPSSGASSSGAAPSTPERRQARSEIALRQITNLQNRRTQPDGLARGIFPGGPMAARRVTPIQSSPDSSAASVDVEAGPRRVQSPRMAKFSPRPATTQGRSPPEGRQMVRAPPTLRTTRGDTANATEGGAQRGGPNLRGRRGPGSTPGTNDTEPREPGVQRRKKKDEDSDAVQPTRISDIDPATTLSDGMVHHLLRLQRGQWDRTPYEPKYKHGSFEAQSLIYEGRELFRGEAPPVKYWGKLERRIGLVGMFGAEAHLKVRRVPDGDAAPFGQEEAEMFDVEASSEQKKEVAVQ
ncbi:hypothetical protein ACEQ8H_005162 [Pleosporales sp. CAS-2024a]